MLAESGWRRDEGIGLPSGTDERIFEAFTRADNARALGVHGAGLGLYICHRIVESHGGRMWAESLGEGAARR
jgi:signal transduction histidine kinase